MRANNSSSLNKARVRHNFRLSREESTLVPPLSLFLSFSISFKLSFTGRLDRARSTGGSIYISLFFSLFRATRSTTTIITRLPLENCSGVGPLLGIRSLSPPHFYRRPSARYYDDNGRRERATTRDFSRREMRDARRSPSSSSSWCRRCCCGVRDARTDDALVESIRRRRELASFFLSPSLSLSLLSLAQSIANLRFDLSFPSISPFLASF